MLKTFLSSELDLSIIAARDVVPSEHWRVIGDEHIAAEIGQVLAGEIAGRQSDAEITVYKSLGHVVQDLASAWALYREP